MSVPLETPSSVIRSPPRKVLRSSTPGRQYQPPVVTTNVRYLGQQALLALDDKQLPKTNAALRTGDSVALTDVLRMHTEKVHQLQKAPSKKRQLPRLKDPLRVKCHWDMLLEEMAWVAADFIEERHWKRAA
ncbi:hypothetical protein DYB28_016040, partial [Aphanomyces astaci]